MSDTVKIKVNGQEVEARKDKADGVVIYRVLVDPRGKMIGSRLEQGVHELCDRAALFALEKMRFSPAMRKGNPVKGELLVEFPFVWTR